MRPLRLVQTLFAAQLFFASWLICFAQQRGLTVKSGSALDGRGRLWAVVIGISSYGNLSPEQQLKFAHHDAEEFAAFLRSPSGGGFPSTQIKLLLNQNATLSAIRTALGTWLVRSAEPDDVVFIFFAGHGVVEGERDGYLLAYDSDPQNLYATALSISELDRIITERLRARVVVLMADACHAGRIGWASRGSADEVLISRYLDEIGKSGTGVFRLLASRPDERSYEDARWGGGHGAFTYFLLQGLKGKADRDRDGVVRAAELLDYLSEVVPEETRALQHPRAAGHLDPKLPLAVVSTEAAQGASATIETRQVSLEVRGVPGSEVYLNNSYRGRIRPNGILVIEGLNAGRHEVSIDAPGAEPLAQTISLTAARTILDLKAVLPASASIKSSPLVAQIRQALSKGAVLEPGGAWSLYRQLVGEAPSEPQRASIEVALSNALEEIGQQAINDYVRSFIFYLKRDLFRRAAEAFNYLKVLRPTDPQLESKRLFCEGRALIDQGNPKEAIALLKKSISVDPKATYSYNALGVAYEAMGENDKAMDMFKRAAQLTPQWAVPRLHIALQHYFVRGDREKAEREFKAVAELDPRYQFARWLLLAQLYRSSGRYKEAEKEAIELVRMAPNYPPVYFELGLIYEAAHQYKKAADAFSTYLQLVPNSADGSAILERVRRNRQLAQQQPSLKRQ
jgi:tetratricopeptide (TPR) repeat protein/uncharacterized caspase-like protein